jgi:hypothetical protein
MPFGRTAPEQHMRSTFLERLSALAMLVGNILVFRDVAALKCFPDSV